MVERDGIYDAARANAVGRLECPHRGNGGRVIISMNPPAVQAKILEDDLEKYDIKAIPATLDGTAPS